MIDVAPEASMVEKAVGLNKSVNSEFTFLRALGVSFILTILSLMLFGIHFETHDDTLMSLIVSGEFGSSGPSPDLWYSHRLLGLLLSRCYRAFPNVNWYVTLQITVQICAHAAWLWIFQRAFPGARGWWCFAIWFVTVGWLWLIPLQFTTVAFVAFTAGMALIVFDANRNPDATFLGVLNPGFWTGFGFLFVSHLIRHQSFLLGCCMAIPIVGLLAYWCPRRTTLIQGCRGSLACGLIFISHYGEAWYYNCQPEWKDYRQSWLPIALLVNSDRLSFTQDNPRFASHEEQQAYLQKLKQIGWTPHDVQILRGGFVDDKVVFSSAKKAMAITVLYPPTKLDHQRFWSFAIGAPFYWFRQPIVLVSILVTGLVVWRLHLSRSFIVAIIASLLIFFLLAAYLKAFQKLPYRVFRIMAMGPILTVFIGTLGTRRHEPGLLHPLRAVDWMIAAVSIAASSWLLQGSIASGQQMQIGYSHLQQDFQSAPISKEYRYVMYNMGILWIPPLVDTSCFHGWSWIFSDCLGDHPLYRERIRDWGWHDASEGLRTDPRARLVSNDAYAAELQQFFNEHYPEARLIKDWSGQEISIYRVVKRSKGKANRSP